MESAKQNDCSTMSLWGLIFSATQSLRQFALLSGLMLIATLLVASLAYSVIRILNGNKVVVEQTSSGGLIYKIGNESTLSFLLSAADPWSNTNFPIKAGDKLTFRASGKINTAFHHLIRAAQTDSLPDNPWIGPDGVPDNKVIPKQDLYRRRYRVMASANYGALIGGIGTISAPPTNSEDMFLIGSSSEITVPANKSGYLWVIVNEVMLTPDHPDAYEVPDAEKEPGYKLPRKFADIKKDNYWNVWYDDNIGDFFVSAKLEPR